VCYPTGCYGTFVQWLCNTPTISGPEDLPFHVDGNSHKYVLSDQYRILLTESDYENFVHNPCSTVVSCDWPVDHNGRIFNYGQQKNFYLRVSKIHLNFFTQYNVRILLLHPTETSEIWWYHNNCKKVFYNQAMFEKKIIPQFKESPWLTTVDQIQRAKVQLQHYGARRWFFELMKDADVTDLSQLSLGQLRRMFAVARHEEMADYVSHWQQLPDLFPNIKFVSLDQLRDRTRETILDIFNYFGVESHLPLDFVIDQWTALQTTRNRDAEHSKIINCIVNNQILDWSELNLDFFDEVYLYYTLRFQYNINLAADNVNQLPTNTRDLLQLAN